MTATTDEVHAGIRSEAVRAKTGKGWAEWFAILDNAGAAKWSHKEIAKHMHELGCGDWWSQMVTVGYEQARGLRVKHQTAEGFSASGSKTVAVPLAKLYAAWTDSKTRAKWLSDKIEIRRATKNKSMRIIWSDGASIDVQFYVKGPGKSQVTIERRRLANVKEVRQVKKHWTAALEKLQAMLEGTASSNGAGRRRAGLRQRPE
jgi:uncharacterized protein YndB with AHSA1/START domain